MAKFDLKRQGTFLHRYVKYNTNVNHSIIAFVKESDGCKKPDSLSERILSDPRLIYCNLAAQEQADIVLTKSKVALSVSLLMSTHTVCSNNLYSPSEKDTNDIQ